MKWIASLFFAVPLVLAFVPGLPAHGYHLLCLLSLPFFFWRRPAHRGRLLAYGGFLLLQTLAYPAPDWGILGWFLLLPWIWARQQDDGTRWFWTAWFFGFLRAAAGFYWLGNIHWVNWIAVAVPSGLLFALSYEVVMRKAKFLPFALRGATAWIAFEWVHNWVAGGFPWLYLGHTQHDFAPVRQLAAIAGVSGISFVMAYAQHAVFDANRRARVYAGVLVAAALAIGWGALPEESSEVPRGQRKVLLVQTALSQSLKEQRYETPDQVANTLVRLTREGMEAHPDTALIVWPETIFPAPFREDLEGEDFNFMPLARQLAQRFGVPGIYGAGSYRDADDLMHGRGYNSAVLVRDDGSFGGIYRKRWLVPMGEEFLPRRVLPHEWADSAVAWLVKNVGFPRSSDLRRGEEPATLDAGVGLRCAMSICFEGLSPEMTANSVEVGNADLVLNLVNNGWFGDSWEAPQMVAIFRFRAVESGVPFLCCANGGISCAISPTGEIIGSLTAAMEPGVLAVAIPDVLEPPIYRRGGRFILPIALGVIFLGIFLRKGLKKVRGQRDFTIPS